MIETIVFIVYHSLIFLKLVRFWVALDIVIDIQEHGINAFTNMII